MELVHGRVNRQKLAKHLGALDGALGVGQSFAQQGNHLAIVAPPLALVFEHHHLVKGIAQDFGLLADVLVTPIARAADDHGSARSGHGLHRLHQRQHGVGVVAIVGNHGGTAVVEQVEAASCVVAVVGEVGQALADG